jgi:hypothetical protein
MTSQDIVTGVKLRTIVDLPDHPTGSIGVVVQIANHPWRFWLCWPLPTRNRYSLSYEESDLRHFELIQEPLTEAACASANDRLSDKGKPRRGRDVSQLRLPLD